jgi:hypothetical protein
VHITTDRMELRIMELEDTVKLLLTVVQGTTEMIGKLNEISKLHTNLIQTLGSVLTGGALDDEES